jgi:hypothetical protein
MTKAAKITYFAALLVGLSIGTSFGFQTAAPAFEAYYSGRQLAAPMVLSHYSYLQYSYADPAHAEAALRTSARLLEGMEKLNPDEAQERELSFTYTRLALLEDAAGNSEHSHALMTKARYWYASSSGRDYSESEMKTMLKILDEYHQP